MKFIERNDRPTSFFFFTIQGLLKKETEIKSQFSEGSFKPFMLSHL